MLAFLVALMLAVPAAAQAQDTGTYLSAPLEWGTNPGSAWVDYNADRKADYCRITPGALLQCTLATGRGFGATVSTPALDAGYAPQRLWGDVDGNGGADYCRQVDSPAAQRYQCSLASPAGFTIQPVPETLVWGDAATLVDATGDGKADYCRVTSEQPPRAICSPFTANGFGPGFAVAFDPNTPAEGRAWADVNGDGKADFCRVYGALTCSLSSGSGFSGTLSSAGALDLGYPPGRSWADVNGDGRADYCREVGNGGPDQRMSCTLATPSGFDTTYVSQPLEWGGDHAWSDFNGDGYRDFCRTVGVAPSTQLFCTLWTPAGFGETIASGPIDVGYAGGRAWVDHNGDGKVDYCRLVGDGADPRVSCTTSTGTAFGPVPVVGPPAPPPPAPPVKKARLVVALSWAHKVNGRYTRFTRLQVKSVPAGAKVKVTCKKGCTRKSYTVTKKKRGTVSLMRLVKNKRLRSGSTIRVVVSRPGNLAAIKTLKMRTRKAPTVKTG